MAETKQITTQPDAVTTIGKYLAARRKALESVVPKHLSLDRLMRLTLNCVAKTPLLQQCSASSIMSALNTCAELGLEPGGAMGEAYLVPYKDKRLGYVCQLIPGYRGFVTLMRRSGQMSTIKVVAVHQKDKFRYVEGIDTVLEHEPAPDVDPGPLTRVYCVIKMKDGGVQVEVMSRAQVDAIRERSKSKDFGPWVTDYEAMAKKTVIRRAAKLAPMSPEVAALAEADDQDFVDGEVLGRVTAPVIPTRSTPSPAADPATAEPPVPPDPVVVPDEPPPPSDADAPPPGADAPPQAAPTDGGPGPEEQTTIKVQEVFAAAQKPSDLTPAVKLINALPEVLRAEWRAKYTARAEELAHA